MVLRAGTWIIQAAFTEGQQDFYGHILVYRDLAGEPKFSQLTLFILKFGSFSFGHIFRFTIQEFYPAGSTAGIPPAAVQWFTTVILKRVHQPCPGWNLKLTDSLDL